MKTKQERMNDNIKRINKLKDEVIKKYSDVIDYDNELSLYDLMMEHFVAGDFDDVFLTDVTDSLDDKDKKKLFSLARSYVGLCFARYDVDYWLESIENAFISDYDFIAYSIFDNYNYLLELARDGGIAVLRQLSMLRENDSLHDVAIVNYLRNTFVDDTVLKIVLLDMSKENSLYDIFSNEQKGTLLNFPEGTLYSYDEDKILITSPYVLGKRLFNDFNRYISDEFIGDINDQNVNTIKDILKSFLADDSFDFDDNVLDLSVRYRDYMAKGNVILNNEAVTITYDNIGDIIEKAWENGDGVLGSSYETPYEGGSR